MVNPDLFALLCYKDVTFKPPKLTCVFLQWSNLSLKVRVILILESLIINYTSSNRTQASTKSSCDFFSDCTGTRGAVSTRGNGTDSC